MSLDILPNEILIKILTRLALQERILLRGVSTRWKVVIEDSCQQKRSLMLMQDIPGHFLNEATTDHFDYDYFVLKAPGHDRDDDLLVERPSAFNETSCELLAVLFPNLDRFVLQLSRKDDRIASPMLYYLLEKCWPDLKSLSLIGQIPFLSEELPEFTLRICAAINSMTSLKHLDLLQSYMFLTFMSGTNYPDNKPSRDLSETLPRLDHFAFGDLRNDDLAEMLCKLGPRCTSLEFNFSAILSLSEFKRIAERNAHLANLTHLRVRETEEDHYHETAINKVDFIGQHFTRLQSLYIDFDDMDQITFDCKLMHSIAKLSHLTELTIKNILLDDTDLYLLKEYIEADKCPRIESVKCLTLRELRSEKKYIIDDYDDNNYHPLDDAFDAGQLCKALAFIFPKLEVITFKNVLYPFENEYSHLFVAQLVDNGHYFEHLRMLHILQQNGHQNSRYGRHKNRFFLDK